MKEDKKIFKVSKIFSNKKDAEKEKEYIEGLIEPSPKTWIEWEYDRNLKKDYIVYFQID